MFYIKLWVLCLILSEQMETEVTVGGIVHQIMYVSANRSDVSLCSTVFTIWFSLGTKTTCHGIILTSHFNNRRVGQPVKLFSSQSYFYDSLISKNKLFIETRGLFFALLSIEYTLWSYGYDWCYSSYANLLRNPIKAQLHTFIDRLHCGVCRACALKASAN